MEMKDDESQALRLRVDQISSELDKQDRVRAVNTKWMLTVGAVIVAALGYTNFFQLPREAAQAASKAVGEETIKKAEAIVSDLGRMQTGAKGMQKEAEAIVSDLGKIQTEANGIQKELETVLAGFVMPVGGIIAWHPGENDIGKGPDGKTKIKAPEGWALCDGSDGTPNLTGRFIRGTMSADDVGTAGGTEDHNHGGQTIGPLAEKSWIKSGAGTQHVMPLPAHWHTIKKDPSLPPYISLVYIMKK